LSTLLADAEVVEDAVNHLFRDRLSGDLAERAERRPKVDGDEIRGRRAAVVSFDCARLIRANSSAR